MAPVYSTRARSAAPPSVVWEVLADGAGWSTWTFIPRTELERRGHPEPDGVGAIRRFGRPPVVTREAIVEFEPPTHLAYVLLGGLPVRGYRADVWLAPDGTGTAITWSGTWEGVLVPGTAFVLRAFLRRTVAGLAKAAAREAERRAK